MRGFNKKTSNKGFTLLEVMIAIFVITVGMIVSLSVITRTIGPMAVLSSKLIAAYLAQEGVEIVRNIRDTNWVEGAGAWDEGLIQDSWLQADYDDESLVAFTNQPLNIKNINNNGFYTHDSGEPTKFYRRIWLEDFSIPYGEYALIVKVEVYWLEKGTTEVVQVEDRLYPWH